ncbi:hypothetical protein MATL_G00065570 [Megalops atlanticus]|uniref:Uncharacterized protein n=1 Tax=Megalops atlanticus TaxID=7932 RepID=A0A9D3Q8T4_MEGAT|nr:hypothetical protein MATL_G00065570 [Megalops atlanticus]
MLSGTSVRYEKLRRTESDICDEQGSDRENQEEEEDEAKVFLYSTLAHQHGIGQRKRDTCLRLCVALVLLTMALGFVILEGSMITMETRTITNISTQTLCITMALSSLTLLPVLELARKFLKMVEIQWMLG